MAYKATAHLSYLEIKLSSLIYYDNALLLLFPEVNLSTLGNYDRSLC